MWHSYLLHRINNKTHNQPHSHTTCHTHSLSLSTLFRFLSPTFYSFSFFPFRTNTKIKDSFFISTNVGAKRPHDQALREDDPLVGGYHWIRRSSGFVFRWCCWWKCGAEPCFFLQLLQGVSYARGGCCWRGMKILGFGNFLFWAWPFVWNVERINGLVLVWLGHWRFRWLGFLACVVVSEVLLCYCCFFEVFSVQLGFLGVVSIWGVIWWFVSSFQSHSVVLLLFLTYWSLIFWWFKRILVRVRIGLFCVWNEKVKVLKRRRRRSNDWF